MSRTKVFTSKSDVLKFLQKKLKKSKIEKIFDFTISDWTKNEKKILEKISTYFNSSLIVRSSAGGEDSFKRRIIGTGPGDLAGVFSQPLFRS